MAPRRTELKDRLDDLLDQWLTASPGERFRIVLEKIRLEEALEEAEAQEKEKAVSR